MPVSRRVSRTRTSEQSMGFPNVCFICEQPFLSKDKPKAYFCPEHRFYGSKTSVQALIRQLSRARKLGAPADLTWAEWSQTLNDFEGMCAYCQKRPYQVLEHFIPLGQPDSGTTVVNCVPACYWCNRLKGARSPETSRLPSHQIVRVRTYLVHNRRKKIRN